jgi:hypothetical protein
LRNGGHLGIFHLSAFIRLAFSSYALLDKPALAVFAASAPLWTRPARTKCAAGRDDCCVTGASKTRSQIVRGPLRKCANGGHLNAGGLSPLSFAYFSLRRQRKVGAAPHRGNANKPKRKQGKANAVGRHQKANATSKQPKQAPQAKPPNKPNTTREPRPKSNEKTSTTP